MTEIEMPQGSYIGLDRAGNSVSLEAKMEPVVIYDAVIDTVRRVTQKDVDDLVKTRECARHVLYILRRLMQPNEYTLNLVDVLAKLKRLAAAVDESRGLLADPGPTPGVNRGAVHDR